MKFLLPLVVALLLQCAASKSWNSDSYPDEAFSVFGWIGYLKRLFLVALMLSGVILYYVPESRPHARNICYILIDLTASGLKSVLSTRDDDVDEKIRSQYHRVRYERSLAAQKRVSKNVHDVDDDSEYVYRNQGKRAKMFADSDRLSVESREKKKMNARHSKEHWQSRHRLRSDVKRIPGDLSSEVAEYLYSDRLNSPPKYLKNNSYGTKLPSNTSVENYALLISGSPRQMAMLDGKYEKGDVVIVQDPYSRMEYKECATSTDNLSSKPEISDSEQEGPTRDYNNLATESGMETYVQDVELNSTLVGKPSYQTIEYQCGGECCGNGCSTSLAELNNKQVPVPSLDTKNVLKSSQSMTPKLYNKTNSNECSHVSNYTKHNHGDRVVKSNSLNNRKVGFRKEDEMERIGIHSNQLRQGDAFQSIRRRKSRTNELLTGFCCNDVSYFTDRGGEADDETSHHEERFTAKLDLDEKPQRENYPYECNSDDSIFDHFYTEPILKNRLKPALFRAINWIFGGCPEASKRYQVEKEENHGIIGGWLH